MSDLGRRRGGQKVGPRYHGLHTLAFEGGGEGGNLVGEGLNPGTSLVNHAVACMHV